MRHWPFVVALALLASGCITSRAQTPVERPTLDVPPVPPRVIDPAPPPEPPAVEPVSDLPPERTTPPVAKPRPSTSRENSKETVKPEPAKPTDIPPVEQPPPAPTTTPPLRSSPVDAAAAEKRIRDTLSRSQGILNGLDPKKLGREYQAAYEQSKSHIDGAEIALKASNFDLAKELADKAEKLARQIPAR